MTKRAKEANQVGASHIGQDALRKALILKGWLLPTTAEDVRFLEKAKLEDVTLPPHLADPEAVLAQARSLSDKPANQFFVKAPMATELARAAREGGEISADIEARMKAAREEADRDDKSER